MKPIIGVTPHYSLGGDEIGIRPGYLEVLESVGALPVMLPLAARAEDMDRLLDGVDGILMTGGVDVCPRLYGEEPLPHVEPACTALDAMEADLVPAVFARDMPLLGICRGFQMINVVLGGTLYQDLAVQYPSGHAHRMTLPFDRAHHRVAVREGSPLYEALGKDTLPVNSLHHQAIKDLAHGLVADATSFDGLVEAFHHPGKTYVRGVQWHPELMWRTFPDQQEIVRHFVNACR